jgi:putative hemolysin
MKPLPVGRIDVMELLRAKNPRLAERLPGAFARMLRLVAHESTLNRVIVRMESLSGCEFVDAVLHRLDIGVEVTGVENLPDSSRIVVCANHPTGGIDGLIMMSILCRRYGSVRVPANDLLMVLGGLGELLVPVDKHGSNAAHLRSYQAMYASDYPVLLFPAGRTARPLGGRLREFSWNKAFVKQARLSDRVIVPVFLSGRNSRRFYFLWRLRRALGIGANLEMFLLVDELLRRRGERRRVRIGPPQPAQVRPVGPEEDQRRAESLRREVSRWAL